MRSAIFVEALSGPVLPSGRQFEIQHGRQRAFITEFGAGIRSYSVGDWEVLDGYAEDEMCTVARGAPLIPWPNRLADGRYAFAGENHQTPLTEPDKRNALHGLTRWMNWRAIQYEGHRVVMGLLLHPQPGYPFTLALQIEYSLSGDGLSVRTAARNAGSLALPYATGHHPYLTVGTEHIDSALLRIPARSVLEVDQRLIPTGRRLAVDGTKFDFRVPRPVGETKLDTAYADLLPDADGKTRN